MRRLGSTLALVWSWSIHKQSDLLERVRGISTGLLVARLLMPDVPEIHEALEL